jgi:aminoglycoside phosphotransferase (APT) family kinase protein
MTSLTLPPGVQRWLRGLGLTVDARSTSRISSSRNLTLVVRPRAFVKLAAPGEPWLARELEALKALEGGPVATPRVLHASRDRLVVSWLPGATVFQRRRAGEHDDALVGAALASFHLQAAPRHEVAGALNSRLVWTRPEDYASMSPATLRLWQLVQARPSVVRGLVSLLEAEQRGRRVWCHGDLRFANVLVHRARVGFVDLELSGGGDPARDLGSWLAEWLGVWLVPQEPLDALPLRTLRLRLDGFVRSWEAGVRVGGLDVRGVRSRAIAWAGEALLRRVYSLTVHEGAWGEREEHLTRSALGLISQPGRWARHFLGARS